MVLSVANIDYSIHRKALLNDVSFTVDAGQQWAIIGKNGAGKSTLIKCMAGLIKPEAGSILIDGKPLFGIPVKERARLIAYVPQIRDRILPFTVYDFIMMGRFPYLGFMAKASKNDRKIVDESIELTEITRYVERRMDTLSGGELQLVFLAGAVAQRTPILLLDEPTTFLDPCHQQLVRKALDRIHSAFNIAIITVTHEISSMNTSYSHVLALKKGSVSFSGNCSEIFNEPNDCLKMVFDIGFESYISKKGDAIFAPVFES